MRTLKLLALSLALLSMGSCFTAKVAHGDMKIDDPSISVVSKKNHNLIYGLVPLTKGYDAKQYIGDRKDYVTQFQHTFVDGLLNAITFGIYNPTTTTFYVPLGEATKK